MHTDNIQRPILRIEFEQTCCAQVEGGEPGEPTPGLFDFLTAVSSHFAVYVYDPKRSVMDVNEWMITHYTAWLSALHHAGKTMEGTAVAESFDRLGLTFTNKLRSATAIVDDSAIKHTGLWPELPTLLALLPPGYSAEAGAPVWGVGTLTVSQYILEWDDRREAHIYLESVRQGDGGYRWRICTDDRELSKESSPKGFYLFEFVPQTAGLAARADFRWDTAEEAQAFWATQRARIIATDRDRSLTMNYQ